MAPAVMMRPSPQEAPERTNQCSSWRASTRAATFSSDSTPIFASPGRPATDVPVLILEHADQIGDRPLCLVCKLAEGTSIPRSHLPLRVSKTPEKRVEILCRLRHGITPSRNGTAGRQCPGYRPGHRTARRKNLLRNPRCPPEAPLAEAAPNGPRGCNFVPAAVLSLRGRGPVAQGKSGMHSFCGNGEKERVQKGVRPLLRSDRSSTGRRAP